MLPIYQKVFDERITAIEDGNWCKQNRTDLKIITVEDFYHSDDDMCSILNAILYPNSVWDSEDIHVGMVFKRQTYDRYELIGFGSEYLDDPKINQNNDETFTDHISSLKVYFKNNVRNTIVHMDCSEFIKLLQEDIWR